MQHFARHVVLMTLASLAAACGGGDKGSGPSATPASISFVAGDGQTVRIKSAAVTNPAAKVLDATGAALSGATVSFTISGGGGLIGSATAVTGADGVANAGAWTMGDNPGDNALTATVQGASSITATLHATARLPRWTYMVYMAADNNLAIAGVGDIDEMEAAGVNPEVQVVVQGEFNPQEFSLRGCTAACAHLPNFNTFRYAVTGAGTNVDGPNGTVTDIGNRAMTDPNQLKEFVNWARTSYPAERYALVLWNHGGGYTGLLEDLTSTGSKAMSLEELKAALAGTGELDLLNFDMCLMGAYETLVKLVGLAKAVVFSEETEPGEGDPYTQIIDAIQANSAMDGKALGAAIVEAYHASYNGEPSSTTKSAYDMASFATFETSLGTLAATLTANVSTLASALGTASANSQKYGFPQLTDLIDFLDSLNVRTSDNTLKTQIAAVKTAASATGFRLNTKARNGTRAESNRVTRSTGLHVVMPSKQTFDELPASGPASFASYQTLYNGKPWTTFLAAWLTGGAAKSLVDQGENRYQVYLVWDSAGKSKNVDVDLWILEPNGELYIPFLGTVTPNGLLTDDSQNNNVAYEGYITNRYVEPGQYKFYANLFADPQSFGPIYDIVYRTDQTSNFQSLYSPTFPRLTMQTSWVDDPTPTFAEIEAGAYTDLKYAAVLTIASPSVADAGSRPANPFSGDRVRAPRFAEANGTFSRGDSGAAQMFRTETGDREITAAQVETVRRLYAGGKLSAMRTIAASRPRLALQTKAPRLNSSQLLMRAPERR